MVFRRRTKRTAGQVLVEMVYPRGGWRRAASYVGHRLSRLPDTPHRIALGIASGVMASFTPLFGLHFILSAILARIVGGNILAALLGTFLGNPFTFPIIAEVSVQFGSWMLGTGGGMHFPQIMTAMAYATAELWYNLVATVTGGDANWFRLGLFLNRVFLPYLVGGILPGLATSAVVYYVSLPIITAYQGRRRRQLRERFIRIRDAAAARSAAKIAARQQADAEAGVRKGPVLRIAPDPAPPDAASPDAASDAPPCRSSEAGGRGSIG